MKHVFIYGQYDILVCQGLIQLTPEEKLVPWAKKRM